MFWNKKKKVWCSKLIVTFNDHSYINWISSNKEGIKPKQPWVNFLKWYHGRK